MQHVQYTFCMTKLRHTVNPSTGATGGQLWHQPMSWTMLCFWTGFCCFLPASCFVQLWSCSCYVNPQATSGARPASFLPQPLMMLQMTGACAQVFSRPVYLSVCMFLCLYVCSIQDWVLGRVRQASMHSSHPKQAGKPGLSQLVHQKGL